MPIFVLSLAATNNIAVWIISFSSECRRFSLCTNRLELSVPHSSFPTISPVEEHSLLKDLHRFSILKSLQTCSRQRLIGATRV